MSRITCHNVGFCRRIGNGIERTILTGIDASFASGRCSAITGATGAGKSTLLHILAGLVRPTSGEVSVDGQPVSRWISTHRERWRRRIGMIFQFPNLLGDLTVLENVMVPMIPRGPALSELTQRCLKVLSDVRLSHLAQQRVYELSGGERQRVSLARALVGRPAILIADEPTAHQDDPDSALVVRILCALRDQNTTVLVAAHDSRIFQHDLVDAHFALEAGRLRKRS
jgi:putative ABC transport system ATP-binding protein